MPYTLTIHFTLPVAHTGNYRIKYWPNNNPSSVTTVSVNSSPYIVAGLSECAYDGTIETECVGIYSSAQPFSINVCSALISYTPCALVSSNNLTPSDIYLAGGVTDIATGVTLYDVNGNIITTVTLISDSNGLIYNVGSDGVVTTSTGNMC